MPDYENEVFDRDVITKKIESLATKWKQIAVAAIVITIIVAIYGIAVTQQKSAENEAWKKTAEALISSNNKDALAKVIEEYPGTEAVTYATLQLIKEHFDADEITKARLVAKSFLEKNNDDYFSAQIRIEYAKLLEWESRWAEAAAEYSKVNANYLIPESLMGKARCLEQENKIEEAKAEYKKIIDKSDKEGWTQSSRNIKEVASFRLAALKNREVMMAGGPKSATATPATVAPVPEKQQESATAEKAEN